MNFEFYETYCRRCSRNKKIKHVVYRLSKLRGVKLKCCICGHVKNRYAKFDSLKKLKVERAGIMGSNAGEPRNIKLNQEVQNGE